MSRHWKKTTSRSRSRNVRAGRGVTDTVNLFEIGDPLTIHGRFGPIEVGRESLRTD